MKANIIASEAILAYKSGKTVTIVCKYKKATKILKALISLPESKIIGVDLNDALWDGYDESWLITIDEEGQVFCQKAINERDNMPYRGDGYFIIDKKAIGERKPEDFVLGSSEIKVV